MNDVLKKTMDEHKGKIAGASGVALLATAWQIWIGPLQDKFEKQSEVTARIDERLKILERNMYEGR